VAGEFMSRFLASSLIVALLLMGGCETAPTGSDGTGDPTGAGSQSNPPPLFDLTGRWRYEASGDLPAGCLRVEGLRVVEMDDGCNGNLLSIVVNSPAYVVADTAGVYLTFSLSGGDPQHYGLWSYQLKLQSDGSLAGTATRRIEPNGPNASASVVWRRQ
jgi:hypothetical protein